MTYQGSFTTQQDIYVYQEPQPQQPIQKPYNPHPGVSHVFAVIKILVSILNLQFYLQVLSEFLQFYLGPIRPSSTTSNATNLDV